MAIAHSTTVPTTMPATIAGTKLTGMPMSGDGAGWPARGRTSEAIIVARKAAVLGPGR
jgi:hypothetical protein